MKVEARLKVFFLEIVDLEFLQNLWVCMLNKLF